MSAASREAFVDWQAELTRNSGYLNWLDVMSKAETKGNDMNINDVFPSNYLKTSDLQGRKLKLTISGVEMAEMGNEQKPVIFFEGKEKGLILNKTKASILAASYSPETDGWLGKEIALYPTKVNYQGQTVDAIGVEPIMETDELNDDVPF